MHRQRTMSLALTLLTLATIIACASQSKGSPGRALEGTYWRLTEIRGQPVIPVTGPRELHLIFSGDSGRVSGSAGCNRFSGTYTLTGRLQFGPLMSTKMACAEDRLNRQETDFLGVLQAASRHEITGDTLTLGSAEEKLARFVAVPR
jgi:heat shock protein HslJ